MDRFTIDSSCQECHPYRLEDITDAICIAWYSLEENVFFEEFLGRDLESMAVDFLFYWDGSDTEYARIQQFLDKEKSVDHKVSFRDRKF